MRLQDLDLHNMRSVRNAEELLIRPYFNIVKVTQDIVTKLPIDIVLNLFLYTVVKVNEIPVHNVCIFFVGK